MKISPCYFKGDDLLFTLSKRQRDFLALPPNTVRQCRTDRHALRTATILAQHGLVALNAEGGACPQQDGAVIVTPAGKAARAFYDTLRRLRDRSSA